MVSESERVARIGIGGLLAIAPALSIFQGRYATMRGALVAIAATTAVALVWWIRFDPRSAAGWMVTALVSLAGGVLISIVVAWGLGSDVHMILRYSWIPVVRAVAVSGGVCLILGALEGSALAPQRASRLKRRRTSSRDRHDRSPVRK